MFENLCINTIKQNDFINTRVVCWVANVWALKVIHAHRLRMGSSTIVRYFASFYFYNSQIFDHISKVPNMFKSTPLRTNLFDYDRSSSVLRFQQPRILLAFDFFNLKTLNYGEWRTWLGRSNDYSRGRSSEVRTVRQRSVNTKPILASVIKRDSHKFKTL
jgi:hypothetical protein